MPCGMANTCWMHGCMHTCTYRRHVYSNFCPHACVCGWCTHACRYYTQGLPLGSPVTDGKSVYVADNNAFAYSVDLVTGEDACMAHMPDSSHTGMALRVKGRHAWPPTNVWASNALRQPCSSFACTCPLKDGGWPPADGSWEAVWHCGLQCRACIPVL